MKKAFFSSILFAGILLAPTFASAACTNLSSTGGPTIDLQKYLYSLGYLTATPNGVYGPATTAAVKKFQTANGITPTGTVGPITRLAIQIRSCGDTASSAKPATPTTPTTPKPPASVSLISALSPTSGESLDIGSTATLRWSGPAGTTFNVVLQDASSTNQGFIMAGTRATSYDWTVGSVSANGVSVVTPPGKYRVHVTDASQGAQSGDVLSGLFTITAPAINISSVMPKSGKSDGKTAIVLYGSGFNSNTMIDFYGYGRINPSFVSGDGKVLVFTVPSGRYAGTHNFSAVNYYQGSDYSSRSADEQFTVVR